MHCLQSKLVVLVSRQRITIKMVTWIFLWEAAKNLAGQGAEAVILGCTEIGMLVKQDDTPVMLCDTTEIHAAKAVEYALEK